MMLFEEEKGGGGAAAVAAAQATAAGAGAGAGTRVRYVQVEVQVQAQGEVGWEVDDEGGAGRRSGGRWERKGMRKEVGVAVASHELWTECSPELAQSRTETSFLLAIFMSDSDVEAINDRIAWDDEFEMVLNASSSGPAARASTFQTALDERSASSGIVLDRESIVPATASALNGIPRRLSKTALTILAGIPGLPDESKTKCDPKLGDRRSHSRAEEQIVQTAVLVDLSIAPWAAQKLVALRNVPTDVMNMVRTSPQQRQELWPLTHQMIALFISSKLVDLEQHASPCAKICQHMFTCKRGIIQSKSVLANNLGI